MLMNTHFSIATLLIISGLLLSSLVPGGPIETRDFSHINSIILGLFNVYLTVLGLGSFIVGFFLFKRRNLSLISLWMGVSYLIIYLIDLLGIFPKTASAMPLALSSIEIAGSLIAIPIIVLSYQLKQDSVGVQESVFPVLNKKHLSGLVLLSIGIIAFATWSAMGI